VGETLGTKFPGDPDAVRDQHFLYSMERKWESMISLSFERIMKQLEVFKLPRVHYVLAIAEGGLVPASLVALKLKVPMGMIRIRFRDSQNQILFQDPRLFQKPGIPKGIQSVLIVDDVSVTGKSLALAKSFMAKKCKVKTMVFKGKADYVLFPELRPCVMWPWNKLRG